MILNDDACLVIDHGLFPFVAQKLSEFIPECYYFTHWENGAPMPQMDHIGHGLDGIIRVDSVYDVINDEKPGLIVFGDVGHGDWQEDLRQRGFSVFGTSRGELLEDDRIKFRKILEKLKLPVSPYVPVYGGIEELREKLQKVTDKYVKISMYRGAGETFHHKNYEESKTEINRLGHVLDIFDKEVEFIIEDPIKAFVENVAIEWFLNDKGYLSHGIWGIENKNSAYLGKKCEFNKLPPVLKDIADKFLPIYKKYLVRGAISVEGHVTEDGKFWYDDPCMRFGSPPGEVIVEAYDNFPDVLKSIADNETIEPEMSDDYFTEVMLKVREPSDESINVEFPNKFSDSVKLRNLCKMNGKLSIIPQGKETIIGAAVGKGKSIDEAKEKAFNAAKSVKGEGIYYDKDGFDVIDEQIKKAKRAGLGEF